MILLMKSVSFFKQKMPIDHPVGAQSLHLLGLVHHAIGNRDEVLEALSKRHYAYAKRCWLNMHQSLVKHAAN